MFVNGIPSLSSYQSSTAAQQESAAITAEEAMKEHAVAFAEYAPRAKTKAMRDARNQHDYAKANNLTLPEIYDLWPERNQSPESLPAEYGDVSILVKELKSIIDGYDHDEDAHKYNNLPACRVCSAEKALAAYQASLFKGRPLTEKPGEEFKELIESIEEDIATAFDSDPSNAALASALAGISKLKLTRK